MKRYIFFIVAGLSAACKDPIIPSFDLNAAEAKRPQNNITTVKTDSEFLATVTECNLFEIEMGKLAQIAGSTPEVKSFAEMMVHEHTQILNEAKVLAASQNFTLPSELSEENMEKLNSMADKGGKKFDEEYIKHILKDHQKGIREFEDKMKDVQIDSDMKTWLIQRSPVFNHHLISILEIKENLNLQQVN